MKKDRKIKTFLVGFGELNSDLILEYQISDLLGVRRSLKRGTAQGKFEKEVNKENSKSKKLTFD